MVHMTRLIDQISSLSVLTEEAVQIAWDYLERTGEIHDATQCSRFVANSVETMIRQGVRSRLLLSNKAISQYRRSLADRPLECVY